MDNDEGGTGCYCKPEWNVYYWNQTQECFEQESPGPCPAGQYFAYNSTSRSTECNCFKNYVFDPSQGIFFFNIKFSTYSDWHNIVPVS